MSEGREERGDVVEDWGCGDGRVRGGIGEGGGGGGFDGVDGVGLDFAGEFAFLEVFY